MNSLVRASGKEPAGMTADKVRVILNPTAGRRRAEAFLDGLRQQSGQACEIRPTERPGHAEELAFAAAQEGVPIIAAAGGDGTVHEVANGILRAGNPNVIFQVIPIGSANDFAHSLAWNADASMPRPVDVGLARRPDGRERYFINCLGLGFNCAVTREARRIRFLRGIPLYTLALLRALRQHFTTPELTIDLDQQVRRLPTLSLTVGLGRREGNFLLTPDAVVDDGWFDYLQVGAVSRWELLRYIPSMITGRLPSDHPQLRRGRCRQIRVEGESPLMVHLDGEFFCLPEEEMREVEIRLLPGRLRACVAKVPGN